MRRWLLPAYASALRMKCTRHLCHVVLSTLVIAAFSPSCASETTSLTPRRPRRARLRKNSTQNGSVSLWPIVIPSTFAPAVGTDADGDDYRDRDDMVVATDLHVIPVRVDGDSPKGGFPRS